MPFAPSFGPSTPPPPTPATEPDPPTRLTRTVVVSAAAGVIALGVLGGTAVLLLGGGDDATTVALPPAVVAAVPDVAPGAVPTGASLPAAVVQGRNIFVPLVAAKGAAGQPTGAETAPVSEGTVVAPAAAAAAGTSTGSGSGSTTGGTTGGTTSGKTGGGSGATSGSPAAVNQHDELVRELQEQIDAITAQLAEVGSNEGDLREQVDALWEEYDALVAEKTALQQERDASVAQLATLRTVTFAGVPDTDPDAHTLDVTVASTVDGVLGSTTTRLDLEAPETGTPDDVPDTLSLGTRADGFEILLTYLALEPAGSDRAPVVSLQVGTSLYRVSIDGQLIFAVG